MFRFRKQYAKLQQSSKGVIREFYEEAVYFLHQPSSFNLRLVFTMGLMYYLAVLVADNQRYVATVYKRKRMRLIDINNDNLPLHSEEEHKLLVSNMKANQYR